MRYLFGMFVAGGLLLGQAVPSHAQSTSMSASAAYPAGITTGSAYGANWSGYYGLNPGGFPLNTYSQPYNTNGSNYNYMAPGTTAPNMYGPTGTTYGSAYTTPGATTYGNSPATTTYGYAPGSTTTYGYAPSSTTTYGYTPGYSSTPSTYSYGSVPSYSYGSVRRGGMFRGVLGGRR